MLQRNKLWNFDIKEENIAACEGCEKLNYRFIDVDRLYTEEELNNKFNGKLVYTDLFFGDFFDRVF